jgi:hypothetical protein
MTDTVTFGKTTWDTPRTSGGGNGDDFLQLNKDGQFEVRIIGDTGPSEFAVHWTEDVDGQTRRVKCAGPGCILCKEDHRPQIRYLLEVMNRGEDNKCQIVEFGPQVYNQIVSLNNNKHWGNPGTYDILIDRSKARGPSDMYQVMPIGKSDLPADQLAKASEFKARIESVIEKIVSPAGNDEILKKLGRIAEDGTSADWSSGPTAAAATPSAGPGTDVVEDDDDFEF